MRVLVCGGRDFYDWRLLEQTLYEIFKGETDNCIIEGGASGADSLARQYAIYNEIPYEEYKANWHSEGMVAGINRNKRMLDEGKPDMVICFQGGKGTKNMETLAKLRLIRTRVILSRDTYVE